MESKSGTPAAGEVFKLAPGDIDHLYRRLGLNGNILSPFRYNAEQAAVSTPSAWFKELAVSSSLSRVAKRLLEPDLKVSFRNGGGIAIDDSYHAMLSNEDESVLCQMINSAGNIILILFPDGPSFWQWWTSTYASPGSDNYQIIFKEKLDLEILVCVMHCLDIYRRSYLESMLEYRSMTGIVISNSDFVALLKRSLASSDKRWLLPTLFELTPGLKNSRIALKPEHMKKMEDIGFITNNNEITLAEQAINLGAEFLNSWMGSMGWQATTLSKGAERNLSRVFLAPTANANHLFSFETGAGGEVHFRHQANTAPELSQALATWMEALRNAANTISAPAATIAKTEPKRKYCGQCGSEVSPCKKFCGNCGTRI